MGKTNEYLVSVIVPCYNAASYLDVCMASILGNYVPQMQIILVNNGSTDNTLELCNKYTEYGFVTVVDQENQGHCGSKNAGMDVAKGKYIMFVDVDDELLPNSISEGISKIEKEQSDILCFGYTQSTEVDGRVIKTKDYIPDASYQCNTNEEVFNTIFWSIFGIPISAIQNWQRGEKLDRHKRFSSLWSHIYRRDIIERIHLRLDNNLFMYEDGIFNCRYLMECNKSSVLMKPCYLYKKRDVGITMTKYDVAKTDLKVPLLNERNKLRAEVMERYSIDILEWYAGSNVLSIFQICRNYVLDNSGSNGYGELEEFCKRNEIQESIKMYPVGGSIKYRIPVLILKKGKIRVLYNLFVLLSKLKIDITI